MSYRFYFNGGINNSYFFETNEGIIYEVSFKCTPYLFGDDTTNFSDAIFELSVLIEYNPYDKSPLLDLKVGQTLAEIFSDFYSKNDDSITIYICDSSDDKQLVRKRKFDIWFSKYNDVRFFKIDKTLIDKDKNRFPISLILLDSNPYFTDIIDSFISMVFKNNQDK